MTTAQLLQCTVAHSLRNRWPPHFENSRENRAFPNLKDHRFFLFFFFLISFLLLLLSVVAVRFILAFRRFSFLFELLCVLECLDDLTHLSLT